MIDDRNLFRPLDSGAESRAVRSADAPQAAEALFGNPGTFDSWQRSAVFSPEELPRPPFVVEVSAASEIVDFTSDALSVGLAWDDATAREDGPRDTQAGRAVRFTVNSIKGSRLEVWTSGFDNFGAARIITTSQAEDRENEDAKTDKDPLRLGDLGKALKPLAVIAVAIAVIVGIAVIGKR